MENVKKQAIKDLADLLGAHNLSEIEYEENGVRIRVVAATSACTAAQTVIAPTPVAAAPAPQERPEPKPENNLVSPMVGIVYLSKAPGEPPFVKVGDTVKAGDTICLIEAMKTFNPIKAAKGGKIAAVLVESGSPVEFNQPLFTLE